MSKITKFQLGGVVSGSEKSQPVDFFSARLTGELGDDSSDSAALLGAQAVGMSNPEDYWKDEQVKEYFVKNYGEDNAADQFLKAYDNISLDYQNLKQTQFETEQEEQSVSTGTGYLFDLREKTNDEYFSQQVVNAALDGSKMSFNNEWTKTTANLRQESIDAQTVLDYLGNLVPVDTDCSSCSVSN